GDLDEAPAPRRPARAPVAFAPLSDDELPPAFKSLGITRTSLETLARFGFTEPTPIQVEAIPALLNNLDVVGIAQTGSGKTVAFGVPMVERLDPALGEVQGIVLVPTRELAQQVLEVLADLARPWGLDAVGLLGGRSLKADFRALDERPQIVVGTPGRILDHLRRQTLSLRSVRYAVLDEADQMLDIGFLPDIRRILSRTPQRRQTALFSATMPGSIKRLIWQFMTDPETVRVDAEATPVDTIEQIYFEVAQRDKVRAMRELIERELKGRTLIFCNMKRSVDHLARELNRDGVQVGALHGDMDQRIRDRVVQEFRSGQLDVLIATNVAARGLDIPEITHVVNYDVPQNLDEYIHRIGRTGRAGREGKAITLVAEWDVGPFDAISSGIGVPISQERLDLYQPRTSG
ncbi:MAG: DEAD/DEAH box helicase, partial [Dehalococcoidia bacterium]